MRQSTIDIMEQYEPESNDFDNMIATYDTLRKQGQPLPVPRTTMEALYHQFWA